MRNRKPLLVVSLIWGNQGLEFDTVVLADDFIEVDTVRWTSEPIPRPIWGSVADQEEVRSWEGAHAFYGEWICCLFYCSAGELARARALV